MKRLLKIPLQWIGNLLDRVLFVLGAVVFAQIPSFIAHYRQRLGGHFDEAQRDLSNYHRMADELAQGSLPGLVEQFLNSPDERMTRTGELIVEKMDRVAYLQEALENLTNASAWDKLYHFLSSFDAQIAQRTLEHYEMNVPITVEGLTYALIGAVMIGLLFHGFTLTGIKGSKHLAQRLRQRKQRQNDPDQTTTPVDSATETPVDSATE